MVPNNSPRVSLGVCCLREGEDHVKRMDRVTVPHLLILTRSNLHRPYHSSSRLDFYFVVVTLYERRFLFSN